MKEKEIMIIMIMKYNKRILILLKYRMRIKIMKMD